MKIKSKAVIYPTNILDWKRFKNLKSETLQSFSKPESYISSTIKNIIRDKLATSSHQSPYLKDQIPQLI